MPIWTIARHSFKEAIRKRILVVAGIFALALVVTAPLWPAMTDADRVKLVKDVSLTAMTFLGVIVAIFVSAYSLPSDIEGKQIFTLAAKPVCRYQIILGKLCGFLMVFGVILAAMGILGDAVIRSVSTFSSVEVTAAEAPILVNGKAVGAVGKGRELRVASVRKGHYEVVLPADLTVKQAVIAASDVRADKTSGQLHVVSSEALLTYGGVTIARAPEGSPFAIAEVRDDSYLVHLPEELRIGRALVPASHTSPPRRSFIRARRIVDPADRLYYNEGEVEYEREALVLSTSFSKITEIWRFGIQPRKLPAGANVRVLLQVPGIYGVVMETNASGRHSQSTIKEFEADLQITNPKTQRVEQVNARAVWGERFFTMGFQLPREMFDGGSINATITGTEPEFVDRSTDLFSERRCAVWRFRGLKKGRFPAGGRVRGEMQFELRRGAFPAHGGRVAEVEFKIAPPAGGRREIVTVPIRNSKPVEFAFSLDVIDPDGSVDISIHNVPEPYVVGLPAGAATVRLLEDPVIFEWSYFKAVVLVLCQLMLVSAVTVAASTFVSGGVAALFGFFAYFCGLVVNFMGEILAMGPEALAAHHHHGPHQAAEGGGASWSIIEPLLRIFVTITPDVSRFDGKIFVLKGLDVPGRHVTTGVAWALLYVVIFVAIACGIFRRKELG